MTDPPTRQCGAVRRQDSDVLRCGRPAIHVEQGTQHGDWVKIGALDPAHDGIPLGRILDALWERVGADAPDAWRDPDAGGRSTQPDAPLPADVHATGYRVTGRGPTPGQQGNPEIHEPRGSNMVSVPELGGAASNIVAQIREAQTVLYAAKEKITEAQMGVYTLLGSSQEDSLVSAKVQLATGQTDVEGVLQTTEAAIEHLGAFMAKLGMGF